MHFSLNQFGGRLRAAAWDDADAKTFSTWGAFDTQNGVRQKSPDQTGIAYPVAAVSGKIVLIAGMKLASREIVMFVENIP